MELFITLAAVAAVIGLGLWLSDRKKEGKGGGNYRDHQPKPPQKER
jgi:hypothetical protein